MFTEQEIKKMSRKNLSIDQFLALVARINGKQMFSREYISGLDNGTFLGVHKDKDGRYYRMHLKKIWIKHYSLSYRTTKTKSGKGRVGDEILISSFPLPKGAVIKK